MAMSEAAARAVEKRLEPWFPDGMSQMQGFSDWEPGLDFVVELRRQPLSSCVKAMQYQISRR
eukprot:3613580-Lingulodinium_polyedra.AAC.1